MSDLIGKWVLLESDSIGAVCGTRPHLVTDVSGSRVYLSEATDDFIDDQWVFDGGSKPIGYKKNTSIKFYFDSFDECVLAAKKCSGEYDNWIRDQQKQMRSNCFSFIEGAGGKKPVLKK